MVLDAWCWVTLRVARWLMRARDGWVRLLGADGFVVWLLGEVMCRAIQVALSWDTRRFCREQGLDYDQLTAEPPGGTHGTQ